MFNKKTDIKNINECNQELKKVFDDAFFIENGWVIGNNVLEIGVHFSRINNFTEGLYKFIPENKICKYSTKDLFNVISEHKKMINDLTVESNTLYFKCDKKMIEDLTVESSTLYFNDDKFVIGTLINDLPRKHRDTVEVIRNNIELLTDGIELDDDTVHTIYKNKHFVIVNTPIEEVRISKQLLPAIKSTAKSVSKVIVYAIPSDNEFMFKVIFKVVNDYVTHYHMYMVIRKERC